MAAHLAYDRPSIARMRTLSGRRGDAQEAAPDERTSLLQDRQTTTRERSSTLDTQPSASKRRARTRRCRAVLVVGTLALAGAVAALVVLARTGLASTAIMAMLSSLSSLSGCTSCFTLLVPIRQLALLGDTAFSRTFTSLCIDLRIQPADVCRGALERQGPAIAQSLRQIQPNKHTAASFCSKMFGLCSSRGESVADWPGEMFPPPSSSNKHRKIKKPSGKRRKIVQISDVHIDRLYRQGTEARCGRVLCCRADPDIGHLDITPVSEPHSPAGPFGDPNCDAPYSLFKSMLEAINEHAGDADFVVSTGDISSHAVWEESRESTTLDLLEAYSIMRSALTMPVFGTIGNHDTAPVNLFPLSSNPKAFQASQWVYDVHYTAWQEWIGAQVGRTSFFDNSGSYAFTHAGLEMRIISINTNFWSLENWYAYASEFPAADPQGVLAFLIHELQVAETAGQHALIFGHAAPATAFPTQSHYFDQVVQRYRSTIVAQLYGHTHSSDYIVSYSTPANKNAETASSISLVSGAMTPFNRLVNPGFRVYELDEVTGEIWDWKEYYTNITEPEFQKGPQWKVLYSAREEYGPLVSQDPSEPLRPAFWHKLSYALEDSVPAFRRFIHNKYRGSEFARLRACKTDNCRRWVLCGLRRSRSEEKCGRIEPPTILDDALPTNRTVLPHDQPSEAEARQELEESPLDFGMPELMRGILLRAKEGHLHAQKKGLHALILSAMKE